MQKRVLTGSLFICWVDEVRFELLKNCYSSRGVVGKNENFEICAITYLKVSRVKFKISGNNYYKEQECWLGTQEKNSKIWKQNVSISDNGKFSVHIDCLVDGKWQSCFNKSIRYTADIRYAIIINILPPNFNNYLNYL